MFLKRFFVFSLLIASLFSTTFLLLRDHSAKIVAKVLDLPSLHFVLKELRPSHLKIENLSLKKPVFAQVDDILLSFQPSQFFKQIFLNHLTLSSIRIFLNEESSLLKQAVECSLQVTFPEIPFSSIESVHLKMEGSPQKNWLLEGELKRLSLGKSFETQVAFEGVFSLPSSGLPPLALALSATPVFPLLSPASSSQKRTFSGFSSTGSLSALGIQVEFPIAMKEDKALWNFTNSFFQIKILDPKPLQNFFEKQGVFLSGVPPLIEAKISGNSSRFQIQSTLDFSKQPLKVDDLTITGFLTGELSWDSEGAQPWKMKIRGENVDIHSPEWTCQHVEGEVTLDRFFPFQSKGGQVLRVQSFRLGNEAPLEMKEGEIHFRIESLEEIFVEKMQWKWCGGDLLAHAFSLHFPLTDLSVDLFFSHIQVGRLFELFKNVQVEAKGELYGKFPFSYKKGRFEIQKGFLYSTPGGGSLKSSDMDLSLLMGKKNETNAQLDLVQEALKDFSYDLMKLNFNGTPSHKLQIDLELHGHSRQHEDYPPIELKIHIPESPLEDLLSLFLKDKDAKHYYPRG